MAILYYLFTKIASLLHIVFVWWPQSTCFCVPSVAPMNQGVSYRVVAVVAGNSDAVTLSGLKPDTQYQVTVAAVWAGKKYRSRPIVFRTLGEY